MNWLQKEGKPYTDGNRLGTEGKRDLCTHRSIKSGADCRECQSFRSFGIHSGRTQQDRGNSEVIDQGILFVVGEEID